LGQQSLDCSVNLDGLLHIGAGESRTESVSVSLNAGQTAAIQEIFTNGFFVEGYLLLEGAENCCDISIPLLGFHGDWAKVPIMGEEVAAITGMGEKQTLNSGYSFAQLSKLIEEILASIPEEKKMEIGYYGIYDFIQENATEEQKKALDALKTNDYYISPNDDGLADNIGMVLTPERYGYRSGLDIYDAAGELVVTCGFEEPINFEDGKVTVAANAMLYDLEDGVYTARCTSYIDYPSSIENPQVKEIQFTIDNKEPEVTSELIEKDGRQILKVTASDANLDGIYISGLTEKEPKKDPYSLPDTEYYTMAYLANDGGIQYSLYNNDFELPPIGKMLKDIYYVGESDVNFYDTIVAEPDENGVFTFEYDVTDLNLYTVSVMDKAYNISTLEKKTTPVESITDGVYIYNDGLVCFADGKMSMTSFKDGSVSESDYTLKNGTLILKDDRISLQQINETTYRMLMNEGSQAIIMHYYAEGTLEEYPFYTIDQIESRVMDVVVYFNGYDYFDTHIDTHMDDDKITVVVTVDGISYLDEITLNIFTGEILSYPEDGCRMLKDNLFPITFKDLDLEKNVMFVCNIDTNEIYYADFSSGKAFSQQDGSEMSLSYTFNNKDLTFKVGGKYIYCIGYTIYPDDVIYIVEEDLEEEEDSEKRFKVITMMPFCTPDAFHFYNNNELIEMAQRHAAIEPEAIETFSNMDGTVSITLKDEKGEVIDTYTVNPMTAEGTDKDENPVDIKEAFVPELPENAYSLEKLCEMASTDYEKKSGVVPANVTAEINKDSTVSIVMADEDGNLIENYVVNAVSGEGKDSKGEAVNLPQTGILAPDNAAKASASVFLTLAGFFVMLKSNIFRKKKENG